MPDSVGEGEQEHRWAGRAEVAQSFQALQS